MLGTQPPGRREAPPDDGFREAIHLSSCAACGGMDCFVASAPRNDGGHSSAFSRRIAPEVCQKLPALEIRGRRECRMRAAPAISCAMCTESARMSIQGSGEHPTFPAQWLYGL